MTDPGLADSADAIAARAKIRAASTDRHGLREQTPMSKRQRARLARRRTQRRTRSRH